MIVHGSDPSSTLNLAEVMQNLTSALRYASELSLMVENAWIKTPVRTNCGKTTGPPDQTMDRVVQILCDLARYTDALGKAVGGDIEVDTKDAFEALQLHELATMLRVGCQMPSSKQSGNVEIF